MNISKTQTERAKVGNDPPEAKKVKILVVDDTLENLVAIEAKLSTFGFSPFRKRSTSLASSQG